MLETLYDRCGPLFASALLILSVCVWALGLTLVLGRRRESTGLDRVRAALARAGNTSTQVGLLGSVIGMIRAFAESASPSWESSLGTALALCFWTTAAGVLNALVANFFLLLETAFRRPVRPLRR